MGKHRKMCLRVHEGKLVCNEQERINPGSNYRETIILYRAAEIFKEGHRIDMIILRREKPGMVNCSLEIWAQNDLKDAGWNQNTSK